MTKAEREWLVDLLGLTFEQAQGYNEEELLELYRIYFENELSLDQGEVEKLAGLYRDSSGAIFLILHEHYSSGNYHTASARAVTTKKVADALKSFSGDFTTSLNKSIHEADKRARARAAADMRRKPIPMSDRKLDHLEDSYEFTQGYVGVQATSIKNQVVRSLADAARQVGQRSTAMGTSSKKAADDLRAQLLAEHPDFKFVDKAGRRWDADKYFRVLSKATVDNAFRESYVQEVIEGGGDLIRISSHGANDRCKSWEGRVISLTGKTEGFTTYADMMATGDIFHPHCKHFLIAVTEEDPDAIQG